MIKPPYTKWINDIKTKLGFNRTMTASGEDVVDAVNKQYEALNGLLKTTSFTVTTNSDGWCVIPTSAINANNTILALFINTGSSEWVSFSRFYTTEWQMVAHTYNHQPLANQTRTINAIYI